MSLNYNSDFDFIEDSHTRSMVSNGSDAVTQLELWEWLKSFEPGSTGFMFSDDSNVTRIGNKMESMPNPPSHSGSSFALTMRHLQYIAKHGMNEYKKKMTPTIVNVRSVEDNE